MTTGFGNMITIPHGKPSGSPFTAGSAINGTSIEGGKVVLGQAPGTAGNPGMIINDREIPIDDGFQLRITDKNGSAGNVMFFLDPVNKTWSIGNDAFANHNGIVGTDFGIAPVVQIRTQAGKLFSMLLGGEWKIDNNLAAATDASVVLVRHSAGGANDGFVRGIAGASGNFTTADGKTVTVVSGVITSIV